MTRLHVAALHAQAEDDAKGLLETIRVEVAPINIYAKLDADVRVRLDKEVQSAISQNPDLF